MALIQQDVTIKHAKMKYAQLRKAGSLYFISQCGINCDVTSRYICARLLVPSCWRCMFCYQKCYLPRGNQLTRRLPSNDQEKTRISRLSVQLLTPHAALRVVASSDYFTAYNMVQVYLTFNYGAAILLYQSSPVPSFCFVFVVTHRSA